MRLGACLVYAYSTLVLGCGSKGTEPNQSANDTGGLAGKGGSSDAGGTSAGGAGTASGTGGAGTASGTGGAGTASGTGGAATGSAGTGAAIGGAPAGAGGMLAVAGGASATDFTLVFRDEFDTLDLARWQLMTHSWDGNLALFAGSTVTVQAGELRLALTPAPSGTTDSGGASKSFLGAEVRSVQTVTYGRVRARARLARGSAVVSSLVTIYTPWPADDWNELDIEYLGVHPSEVQFNAMVYTGPPVTPPVSTSVTPTQEPQLVALGFDPSTDFHVYTIEWTPAGARFLVDEVVLHTWSTHIELMGLPQNVLMTIWASSSPGWAGPVTDATGQAVATYDWLELYRFDEP